MQDRRIKRIRVYDEVTGRYVHIMKTAYETLCKKVIIDKSYIIEGDPDKLVIEYKGKRGSYRGVAEFNDLGPGPETKEI
jgi:hypothetical protein